MAGAGSATVWVDDDGRAGASGCASDTPAFSTVQSAVDATGPDHTVFVCPGVYTEQIVVSGHGHDGLTIESAKRRQAVVRAPAALPEGRESIALIEGADRVRLHELKLLASAQTGCDQQLVAILVTSGSQGADIGANLIRPEMSNTAVAGCFWFGVMVTGNSSARLVGNTITDFLLGGVFVGGAGSGATVSRNVLRYRHVGERLQGCRGDAISVIFSAARVRRNIVSGLPGASLDGTRPPMLCTGILVVGTEPGQMVARDNLVRYAFDGIRLGPDDPADFELVDGALVIENDARHGLGLDCVDTSTGDGTAGTANSWTDNLGLTDAPDGLCTPGS
ncbi:MAG: hypothetical protein ACR2LP_02125 [Candidatus Limnocylindrales bacterium]